MRLALFTLAILTLALLTAPTVFAQGAITSLSSFTEPAQFTGVSCIADADSAPVPGLLNFDASSRLRCEADGKGGFAIPYAAVTRMVFHDAEKEQKADTSSRFSFRELLPRRDMLKLKPLNTERYLTIYFNDAQGRTCSSVVRLDNRSWQLLLAVAENKTGRVVERNRKGDNWNWTGNW